MTRAQALELINTRIAEASTDGAEIILTPEEILRQLPAFELLDDASFLYIPFARKAGKSYSLIGPDLTIDRNDASPVATEQNRNGLLAVVGANVPRIEFDANGPKGHLIEGQGTNRVRTDFAFLSGWDDAGGYVSVSLNDAEDDSYLLTPIGTDVKYISDFFDANEGDEINGFIEVKSAGSDFNIRVNIRSSGGLITTDEYAVTSEWTKIILSATVPLGQSDASMQIGGANTWVTGENLLVRRPQLVKNEPAGTWIKNTSSAAVTRLAEGIPMPTAWANAVEDDDVLLTISVTFYDTFNADDLGLFGGSATFSGRTYINGTDGKIRLYSLTNSVQLATGIVGLENWINVKIVLVLKKIGTTYTLYVNGIKTDTNTLAGDLKWHQFITVSSSKTIHQLRVDTDNPDQWTDEYCQNLSQLSTADPTTGEGNYRAFNLRSGESKALSGDLWNYIKRIQVITGASATATITFNGNDILIQPGEDFEFEPQAGQYYGVQNIASSGGTTQFIFWL